MTNGTRDNRTEGGTVANEAHARGLDRSTHVFTKICMIAWCLGVSQVK
jgi:hypothetical protein